MRKKEMLAVVKALMAQPTAPFHEDAVRDEIEAQLREMPHVKFARDAFGNVVAHYQRGRKKAAEWGLAAHMDHPGWVRGDEGEMKFLGSVAARFRSDPKKKAFGDFEMWDLPPCEIRDGQIHSRACDDLIGCAEIICVFRELEERDANVALRRAFHPGGGSRFRRRDQAGEGRDSAAQPDDSVARDEHTARDGGDRQGTDRAGRGQGLDLSTDRRRRGCWRRRRRRKFRCNAACSTAGPAKRRPISFTAIPARRRALRWGIITTSRRTAPSTPSLSRSTISSGWCGSALALVLGGGAVRDPQKALRQKLEENARGYRVFYRL